MGWGLGCWEVFFEPLPLHETETFAAVFRPFLQWPGGWPQIALGFLVALFSRYDLLPSPLSSHRPWPQKWWAPGGWGRSPTLQGPGGLGVGGSQSPTCVLTGCLIKH